ncbi:energy transducer TonB [Polynucleobacter brandtiae]|uniref:Outer membrane transport energization protein TonB n=1 Tax=Polynucleobacter brandtiae TaxID=1938816 RepID=A0A2M8VIL5_9BURK|nr:energy transducer TonB [Polynucleobacter brandtiae]PJI76693.1 outer membrane transport energization protein TonB [Polynucleobacter brandtiae]
MSPFFQKIDAFLPFNKTDRIIIGLVILLHALLFADLIRLPSHDHRDDQNDTRVMANLVSPEAAQPPQPTPPQAAPPPPKPKQEQKKKVVDEKSTQAQTPPQPQEQKANPTTPQTSKSESPTPNAAVAPATNAGSSGTPIQTDIGKLVVAYQPDADAYYPSFSKRSGEQGEVVVRLIIDEGGNVEDVALLRSSSFPRLDRAATEIGRRYRFKPFIVNGAAARISTNLLIKFNLKN